MLALIRRNHEKWLWSVLVFASLYLVSCGGNSPAGSNPYPPAPVPTEPNPSTPAAIVQLGSVQRVFGPQDIANCSLNSLGEVVLTFSNDQSGSSLSLRMHSLKPGRDQFWLSQGQNGDNLLIALGGDPTLSNFQMTRQGNSSMCSVTTDNNQGLLNGTFSCQGLVNRQGVYQSASGNFGCKLQTGDDWG